MAAPERLARAKLRVSGVPLAMVALVMAANLACGSAWAANRLDFAVWMQKIDRASQDVLRHLAAKNADASKADARELVRYYQLMEDFYAARSKDEDAVIASYVGKDLAGNVIQALERNDYPAAINAASQVARDCRDCHYTFKPMRD